MTEIETAGLDLIEDPVWIFDLDSYRIVWSNAAGVALWAADSLEELLERDLSDSSDLAKARLSDMADGFVMGETYEVNWTLYPRRQPVDVRFRCRGIRAEDGHMLMLVHVIEEFLAGKLRSTTPEAGNELQVLRAQLEHAEARFRLFAEAGSDWLWETDQDGKFSYYSASVNKYWAYPLEEVLGMTRFELIEKFGAEPDTPEVRGKWQEHAETLERHEPFRELEYAYKTGTGRTAHAAVSGNPIFDEDGTFLGYRGIGRDITRRVEAEAFARDMLRERDAAQAANSVSRQLIATMSHELRTPLNAIIGFSEIMSKEILGPTGNPTYREYSEGVLDSAHHLLSVIDDLLNLSRMDFGERTLDISRCSADDLFSDVIRMMQPLADTSGLKLRCEMSERGLQIEADSLTIRQVLINLISNAMKFSESGSTITIGCACTEDKGIALFVRDTGCGIAPDELPYVFEPFRTVNPMIARSSDGIGLGLWISRQIAEAHGGEIGIESEQGKGTTVTVHLPAGTCVAGSGEAAQNVA